jgi:hypothetical protein
MLRDGCKGGLAEKLGVIASSLMTGLLLSEGHHFQLNKRVVGNLMEEVCKTVGD